MTLKTTGMICLLGVMLAAALAAATVMAATADGKYVAKMEGPQGRAMEMTFDLKTDGNKLTGTISGGRGGAVEIQDGKVNGNKISFTVKRTFQERTMVMKYDGTVTGSEIKFKQSVEGMDRPPREFVAKKAE